MTVHSRDRSHWYMVLTAMALFALLSMPVLAEEKGNDNADYPSPDEFVPLEEPPEMTYMEDPKYPDAAREAGQTGVVWIRALVTAEGQVAKAQVIRSTCEDCGFEEAAIEAARECRYNPGIQNGRPVASWVSYKVAFSLRASEAEKSDETQE